MAGSPFASERHEKPGKPHSMSKRPPYLEIIVTAAVMVFLALVVGGGFDARNERSGQVTMRAE